MKDVVREQVSVRGPLLVEVGEDDVRWLAPAPADASIHQTELYDEQRGTLVRLVPVELPASALSDTSHGLLGQAGKPDIHKAHPLAPQFWCWEHFAAWLQAPTPGEIDPTAYGIRGLATSARMHVRITAETQTAREGFLYQTRGLEFTTRDRSRRRLALAAHVEIAANEHTLFAHFAGGIAPLGGERRLMRWEQRDTTLPAAPKGLFGQIGNDRACRIMLMTPGYFRAGFQPDSSALAPGLHLTLVAAAVSRVQIVSGWDMLYQHENGALGAPKPTRRLSPAGAVYFVRFDDNDATRAIERWARELWMTCISEDAQSKRDGFGLVALGTWDGKISQIGA
jgi:CRISPR-associated protein Cmr3